MKKKVLILSLIMVGAVLFFITACEKSPVEACEQDLICDAAPEVTACCTDGADCYYTFNGQEFPDTDKGLADLADSLGCGTTKSASVDGENDDIIARLQALLETARTASIR